MQTDTQAQLNITDLIHLADLKDLIAAGKKAEAMPALYSLASKYPQNIEIQDLIRASLNPEILSAPTPNPFQLPNNPPSPYPSAAPNYQPYPVQPSLPPYQPISAANSENLFLHFLGYLALCNVPLIALYYFVISLTFQSSNFRGATSHSPQLFYLQWIVVTTLMISSAIWTILDAIRITRKSGNQAIGGIAFASIIFGGFFLGFPFYLAYRRRFLFPYRT